MACYIIILWNYLATSYKVLLYLKSINTCKTFFKKVEAILQYNNLYKNMSKYACIKCIHAFYNGYDKNTGTIFLFKSISYF